MRLQTVLVSCAALLFMVVASAEAAVERFTAIEAVIHLKNGKMQNGFVEFESLTKVKYGLTAKQMVDTNRDQIAYIDYSDSYLKSTAYSRGVGLKSRKKYDEAIKTLSEGFKDRYQCVREKCYLEVADCYVAKGDYTKAIETLNTCIAALATWPYLADIYDNKGDYHIAAEDLDGAEKTYQALGKRRKDFGKVATSASLLGLAKVAEKRGNSAKAVELLAKAFEGVTADAAPVLYGKIGLRLGKAHVQAGDANAALSVYEKIVFTPVGPDNQSGLHIAIADIYAEQNKLVEACDEAILGAMVPDASSKARDAAVKRARALSNKLNKDDAVDGEVRLAYRMAVKKL